MLFLYSKSPRDLESAKFPFTLFSSTNPFALSILYFSPGLSGLWSSDKFLDFPFLLITALQSPAFAQYISVLVIKITFAAAPAWTVPY